MIFKKIRFVFLLLLTLQSLCLDVSAQNLTHTPLSPYRISLALDLPIGIGALGLYGTARGLMFSTQPLSQGEINLLQTGDINSFDRFTVNNWSPAAALSSDVMMVASIVGGAGLLINKNMRKDWLKLLVMGMETLVITNGVTDLNKRLVLRTRPYVYNTLADPDRKLKQDARYSFFSGHTSNVAAMSFFVAKVINDYFPDKKWRYGVWAGAIVLPAVTGFLRVYAGKHFPTDVITGYAVGAAIGYLIPFIHSSKWIKRHAVIRNLHISPLAGLGVAGLDLRWVF